MQRDWMQCIPWSLVKCIPIGSSGLHVASLNAEDSIHCGAMDPDWMQWSPCSEAQCIPIECSGFFCSMAQSIPIECRGIHAAWLNAVYSMQYEEMEPYWMRGILCSMLEWSGFLQNNWMQWIFCSMAQSIPIECSGFHAASLNAEDSMHCGAMDPDFMRWSPCTVIECSVIHAAW